MVQLSHPSRLIPNISVNIQISLLHDASIDTSAILQTAGLTRDDLDDASFLVSNGQEFIVQREFARLTDARRDLWIAAGLRYRLFTYYPVGFAFITAPDLTHCFTLMQRFQHLHYGLMYYVLLPAKDGIVGVEAHYDPCLSGMADFLNCRDVIASTNWFHELWGGLFPFERIEVASPLPSELGYDFRAPFTLTEGPTRWYWPEELMTMPPAFADPVLHSVYLAQCDAINATALQDCNPTDRSGTPDPLMVRIRTHLKETARFDWSLDQLARDLSMSRRSLQRHLTQRGESFRMIMDQHRCQAAKSMLDKHGLSIADIAWQLGYADTSSFHQAFIRWTQMSPSAYRRSISAESRAMGHDAGSS